jgi:hypothetical protein
MPAVLFHLLSTAVLMGAGAPPHLSIIARVGGKVYPVEGSGECSTSSESTIYDVPATQWHAAYDGGGRAELGNVNVTVWRPKAGGADQVTLYLTAAGRTHRIATVAGGERIGRATASARSEGDGGTLVVEGVSGDGTAIKLELRCSAFSEIVEGNG